MKFREFRDQVLQLLNAYSSNGVVLDNLYNDHSDYVLRIPGLYNSAVTKIATQGKSYTGYLDRDSVHIEEQDIPGHFDPHTHHECSMIPDHRHHGMVKIDLPDDFIKVDDGLLITQGHRISRSDVFHKVGDNQAYVDISLLFGGDIQYCRWPRRLPTEPGADIEGLELDGDIEQQDTAAYYVAAMLVLREDAFTASVLMNEYEARITDMSRRLTAEVNKTPDIYTDGIYGSGGGYL